MVLAILTESDLTLSNEEVESIVSKVLHMLHFIVCCIFYQILYLTFHWLSNLFQTMMEADSKGDGKIDPEEWKEFVAKNPSLIRNMTLPYLKWVLQFYPCIIYCSIHLFDTRS